MAVKKAAVKCAAAKKAPAKKKPDPNRKLRCGVVGLGIGQCHVAGYRSHPNAELVAVADIDPVRLEEIGNKKLNVAKRYSTLTEMLANEDLDIVSIATPNKFHAPLTIEALKAGCHVLCEKPMALTMEECEKMMQVEKETGRKLMIGQVCRCTPAFALTVPLNMHPRRKSTPSPADSSASDTFFRDFHAVCGVSPSFSSLPPSLT